MGTVYRAWDSNLGTDVVIKLPHPAMAADPTFSRRFREEVRSLVRLSHPHIVKVTDVGDWDGVPFAVLQYLSGGSLESRQPIWRGPAALAVVGSWLGTVAAAIDYVHSQKLVHRDVKPANILFDAHGHAYLGDFGVVKVLAAAADDVASPRAAVTGTGVVLGTPYYMAPELIMGDHFDGRVDQYALAITAYELLCGRRPFEHEVTTRILMMHAQDPPPSPSSLSPWIPPQLEQALLKGLAKDPAGRFASCAAFAAAVVEASAHVEGGQAGRVPIRCGTCGQTMSVSTEAFVKLSRPGRTSPCPKCKGPLDLAAGTATVVLPDRPPSGERTHAAVPALGSLDRTVTMAASKPGAATPSPGASNVPMGGGRAATVAEPIPVGAAGKGGRAPTMAEPVPAGV